MDIFNELFNHPNFGRNFQGSSHFRGLVKRYIEQSGDDRFTDVVKKLEIDIDPVTHKIGFKSKDLGYTYKPTVGESMTDFFTRVTTGMPGPTTAPGYADRHYPTPNMGLSEMGTSQVISGRQLGGGTLRRTLGDIADRKGLIIQFRTTSSGLDTYERLEAMLKEGEDIKGLITADAAGHRVLEMWDKRTGKKLGFNEVIGALDLGDPLDKNFAKRVRALFNATQVSLGYEPGELVIEHLDPTALAALNPAGMERARLTALSEKARGQLPETMSVEQRVNEIFLMDTDGLNYQSRSATERMLKKLDQEILDMQLELDRDHPLGSKTRGIGEREIRNLEAEIATIKENVRKGAAFNIRGLAGRSRLAGEKFMQNIKGDIVSLENQKIFGMARAVDAMAHLTDDELKLVDVFAPEILTELDIQPGTPGRLTADLVGKMGVAHSNPIALANFGELYNPVMNDRGQTLLGLSLRDTLDEAVAKFQKGDISPLLGIAKEYENLSLDDFGGDETLLRAAQKRQGYIRRAKEFVDAGGRLESDPVMIAEAMRTVREHHFQLRKAGKTMRFGTENIDDLRLRIPIPGSYEAHFGTRSNILKQPRSGFMSDLPMMLTLPGPQTKDRFLLSSGDTARIYAAGGGLDQDDRVVSGTQIFDPKTKRLLTSLSRDPSAITEFPFFDTDFSLNKDYFKKTVMYRGEETNLAQLSIRRTKILEILKRTGDRRKWNPNMGNMDRVGVLMRELSDVNLAMQDAFRNDKKIIKTPMGEKFSIDNPRSYLAPKGYRRSRNAERLYEQESIVRGYGAHTGDVGSFFRRFGAEARLTKRGNAMLPFEYVGPKYREMFDDPVYGRALVSARERYSDLYRTMDLRAEIPKDQIPKLTGEALSARNRAVAKAEFLLGKTVNTATVVENFVSETIRAGTLTAEQQEQFLSLAEKYSKITVIEREDAIDYIRKFGDEDVINMVEEVTDENLLRAGKILGGMEGLGMDPFTLGQRFKGHPLKRMLQGYRIAKDDQNITEDEFYNKISLSPTDPRSSVGRLASEVLEYDAEMPTRSRAVTEGAGQKSIDELKAVGFKPGIVERARANQFIRGYLVNEAELLKPLGDNAQLEELLQRALETNPGADIADLLSENDTAEVNRRSVELLNSWKLDEHEMRRQLLATRWVAAEADEATGRLRAGRSLSTVGAMPSDPSIARMSTEAWSTQVIDWPAEDKLDAMVEAWDPKAGDNISDQLLGVPDPESRKRRRVGGLNKEIRDIKFSTREAEIRARANMIFRMEEKGGTNSDKAIIALARRANRWGLTDMDVSRGSVLEEYPDEVLEKLMYMDTRTNLGSIRTPQGGKVRLAMRSIADELAVTVRSAPKMKSQKLLTMEGIGELLSNPGFRKGLGIAGIFAGLGMVHEMRGDRSPEDMQGPPLLPGGNPYDDAAPQYSPQSIYSAAGQLNSGFGQQGYTYNVRANGTFDAKALSSQMGSLTGSPIDSTIYQARQTTEPRNSSSIDIINSLIE